jgi:cobalt-zinc-cadmium efflux system outer membrane protein
MPPSELAGRLDAAIPVHEYDPLLAHVLRRHTDILTAQNVQLKARIDLRLAHVTPVPDVIVRGLLQRDHTTPPFGTVLSVQVGVPVPVWDRNQGNIQRAEALLYRAAQQSQRAGNDLTARLAEAFARFESNRTLVDYYRKNILPDQVQTYRGVYQRHQTDPARVSFGDIIVAQQTLVSTVNTYISTLGDFWAAVVDLANLLQVDDLFELARPEAFPVLPELDEVICQPFRHGRKSH